MYRIRKKILGINKDLRIFYSSFKPLNLEEFKDKKLLAVAAIGNPNNFFKLLRQCNLDVKKKIIFPDHHEFSKAEVKNIFKEANDNNYHIITTEKDYFKFNNSDQKKLNFLKVSLQIDDGEKLIKIIQNKVC